MLFPNSDLRTAKTRPALIVQADQLGTGLPQVIIAMISSRMFRSGHPSRVIIQRNTPIGQQSGLLTDSVVMTEGLGLGIAAVGISAPCSGVWGKVAMLTPSFESLSAASPLSVEVEGRFS